MTQTGPDSDRPFRVPPGPQPTAPGELDVYLFNEGRHHRLWELLGGHPIAGGGATFAVWAPNARRVRVVGDWEYWSTDDADALDLQPQASSGIWWGLDPRATAGHAYKFEITGADGRTTLRADPLARQAEIPPSTASILASEGAFAASRGEASPWREPDGPWRAERAERNAGRLSVYEVHLGSWRRHPDGSAHSARQLAEPLADWAVELGFTHIEVMPVATHPFGGSWGYQVSGYFAPDARLGSPDDLRHLIDVCHDRGLGVIVDWVPAHFPKDEFALSRFDGTALYEHADRRRGEHPDWGTLVFNHGRREVRNFLIANALYWLEEFRVDGLRVDAVASMLYLDYSREPGEWVPNEHGGREDLDALGFVRELNDVVHREHPGALMVAEESTSWPGVTAPIEWEGLGFDRKWNLGWMHDTLGYFRHDSVHRSHHHHELTFPMVYGTHERWILPLSHDEVVHGKGSLLAKMPGDEWQRFANLRALFAWQWTHPGRQLLFMGAELAQEQEWGHDRELDWWLLQHPAHLGVKGLIGDLNRVQAQNPALWAGDEAVDGTFWWIDSDDRDQSVFAFGRCTPPDHDRSTPSGSADPGEGAAVGQRDGAAGGAVAGAHGRGADMVAVVANLTPVPRHGYRLGVPIAGDWSVLLDTDNRRYGGSGHELVPDGGEVLPVDTDTPWQQQPYSLRLTLPPLSVVVLAPPT